MSKPKMKLTIEQHDSLLDMTDHYGWPALITAIELLVRDQEQAVLTYHLDGGVDRLVHAKLRAEGARKLLSDIERFKETLRKSGR